ncbi:DsbA family protein [Sulfurospirillum sp. 1612]|uniref:DsbA family protein n=1 Tax=Sulfurospirillum sp. 1612 TaxID=3094835 RepID=UPI002F92BC06
MNKIKLATIFLLIAGSLSASSTIDKKVIHFENQRFLAQKNMLLDEVKIEKKEKIPFGQWYGYILHIKVDVTGHGSVNAHDILFSNGEMVTPDLMNVQTGHNYKDSLSLKVTSAYYQANHLIAGTMDAKNKVVVFSDPLCPFCRRALPGIIKKAQAEPKKIALFYYQFPLLALHPASDVVSKAMIVAKREGIKDVELKIYESDYKKYFTVKEKNAQKILDGINAILKTSITPSQIQDASLKKVIQSDMKMGNNVMVQGTPTLFVNGNLDRTKTRFAAL